MGKKNNPNNIAVICLLTLTVMFRNGSYLNIAIAKVSVIDV